MPHPPLVASMPRRADYTYMWWADGFPGHTPSAPWVRVVQTGSYAMALATETLRIPHLGPLATGLGYADGAGADNAAWRELPAAELALTITVGGREYRCIRGAKWTQHAGPRLIESGRFLQRGDVTGLAFAAADGSPLNVEARFEAVAWPDRLALILAARPGLVPLAAGEDCFGRIGGGFGLTGKNQLEVPHAPDLEPPQFTLELWAFVPVDCATSTRAYPWLVGKNGNEWEEGNYGIMLQGGRPRAVLNIGGGRENMFTVDAPGNPPLHIDQWNHLAMSYDGDALRLYINGKPAGERPVGRVRVPGKGDLAFGRRPDNSGDGYHFRGAIDEVRFYDRALPAAEIEARVTAPETELPSTRAVREWSFRKDGQESASRPTESWQSAAMEVSLATATGIARQRWELPPNRVWTASDWQETALVWSPEATADPSVTVTAAELPAGADRAVEYDVARGWHRVNLDGIVPLEPAGNPENGNDSIERVKLVLTNPSAAEQIARLLFAKGSGGIRTRGGAPITGVSAILRDPDGNPTGIPVQLSKNWHGRPEGGVYAGQWFHGFSQVRLPPKATVALELNLVYAHWGGVASASHAQLCLIGWGSNQLWEESALGAWGESICYEPDQAQGKCAVLDVRPVMVRSMGRAAKWSWTHNVGGGDFFRLFDPAGERVYPGRMRTAYLRQCPVLTEVLYAGQLAGGRIEQRTTVSLARTDDIVRGIYRLRLDVKEAVDFSRFVLFQIGADSYSYTGECQMAVGNENGLEREWQTQWGGGTYKTAPLECAGRVPWISLHQAVSRAKGNVGAWANRGIVIRTWQARLGGQPAAPWAAEHGVGARGADTSTIDLVPPPGVTRLLPGDFVEATVEHVIMPQAAADYYGPNENLRAALARDGDTWRLIHREAVGNDRQVEAATGVVQGLFPAVRIRADGDRAAFAITGGLGYVPITLCGLRTYQAPRLELREPGGEWQAVDQSVHGKDFWQTDYLADSGTWEVTYSVPSDTANDQRICREYRFQMGEGTAE